MRLAAAIARCQEDPRLRFLVGGGVAALVNWLVRFPLNLLVPYGAAVVLAMAIGMTCGFLLYRAWVFAGSERSVGLQVRDFVLVNLGGMAVTLLVAVAARWLLLAFDMVPSLAAALAHALGIALGAVANYLGHRHITFRSPHRS